MGVYQNAIEYFKRVADSRYVAAGLTSNVDLLVRWDTGVIQKWVDQYATGPRNISNVENMTDLVDMLLFRLPEGGTECFICEEVARTIESSLKMASYGVGGTGAQAACALGSFGVRSLVHLTSFGPQFAELSAPFCVFQRQGAAGAAVFAGKSRALRSSFYSAVS
jgi:hypothetical protein